MLSYLDKNSKLEKKSLPIPHRHSYIRQETFLEANISQNCTDNTEDNKTVLIMIRTIFT